MKTSTPGSIAIELLKSLSSVDTDQYTLSKQAVAKAALSLLSPDWQEVLVLHYTDGWEHEKIADKVGSDPIAVQKKCGQAYQQFITLLRKCRWVQGRWPRCSFHPDPSGPAAKATEIPVKPAAVRPPRSVEPKPRSLNECTMNSSRM